MTKGKDFIDSRLLLLIFLLACQVILTIAVRQWLSEVFRFTDVMRAGEPFPLHYRWAQTLYRLKWLAYIQPLLTLAFLVAVLKKPTLKRYATTFCTVMGVTFIGFYSYLVYGATDGFINDRLRGMVRGLEYHSEEIKKIEKSEQGSSADAG